MNDLPAGRELDELIAQEVMDWCMVEDGVGYSEYDLINTPKHISLDDIPMRTVPEYSTDIAAAWQVVEKLELRGYRWCLTQGSIGYHVVFSRGRHASEYAPAPPASTAPLAICRAALQAVAENSDVGAA